MKTSLLYSLVALLPLTSAFSAKAEVPISPAPSPTPSASPSGSTDSRMSVSELEARIERAYLRADSELLAPAVAQLDADLAVHPNDAASLYLRGFASFAQGCVARAQDDKALFEKCLTAAGETLAKVKGAPWEAEAQALHSYLLGQLIGSKGPAAGMTLGPKSGALLAKAMAAAPTNPRVQLFQGVSLMNTPEMWGGDPKKGARLVEQACAALAQPHPTAQLHWGQVESLVWLGLAKKKAGDFGGARSAWEHALILEPNYAWVKYSLLPPLEPKNAASAK